MLNHNVTFIPKFCSTMLRVHSQGNVMRGNSYDVPAKTPVCVTAPIIPIIRSVIQVRTFKNIHCMLTLLKQKNVKTWMLHFYQKVYDMCIKPWVFIFLIEYNLAVSKGTSSINTSMIQFQWSDPSHSVLITDHAVSIRHNNGTNITGTTVGKQTSYIYKYHFIPGYRYYFRITSNVKIPNPSEQFTEYREWSIVLGTFC